MNVFGVTLPDLLGRGLADRLLPETAWDDIPDRVQENFRSIAAWALTHQVYASLPVERTSVGQLEVKDVILWNGAVYQVHDKQARLNGHVSVLGTRWPPPGSTSVVVHLYDDHPPDAVAWKVVQP